MFKRRRFRQASSLAERLSENVEQLRKQLAQLSPGAERDKIARLIRQSETASHIDEWLKSPGLQPPTALSGLQGHPKSE